MLQANALPGSQYLKSVDAKKVGQGCRREEVDVFGAELLIRAIRPPRQIRCVRHLGIDSTVRRENTPNVCQRTAQILDVFQHSNQDDKVEGGLERERIEQAA